MDTRAYREPPRTNLEPAPRKASWVALVASLLVLLFIAARGLLTGQTWDRAACSLFASAATVVGFGVVIAIKRIHAAWKKRHDAKLMIEWERRLEEKR
jgi:hypothetical protein